MVDIKGLHQWIPRQAFHMWSFKMCVEVWEQLKGEHGLDIVTCTRPDHHLIKYVEKFMQNFDLKLVDIFGVQQRTS